jgi:hypothetical protein
MPPASCTERPFSWTVTRMITSRASWPAICFRSGWFDSWNSTSSSGAPSGGSWPCFAASWARFFSCYFSAFCRISSNFFLMSAKVVTV